MEKRISQQFPCSFSPVVYPFIYTKIRQRKLNYAVGGCTCPVRIDETTVSVNDEHIFSLIRERSGKVRQDGQQDCIFVLLHFSHV